METPKVTAPTPWQERALAVPERYNLALLGRPWFRQDHRSGADRPPPLRAVRGQGPRAHLARHLQVARQPLG
jgi:hypothetical protein